MVAGRFIGSIHQKASIACNCTMFPSTGRIVEPGSNGTQGLPCFFIAFLKYKKMYSYGKMYDAEPKIAAKQHDLIRLCHVNPTQSIEVTWYRIGTTMCLQHQPMPKQHTF